MHFCYGLASCPSRCSRVCCPAPSGCFSSVSGCLSTVSGCSCYCCYSGSRPCTPCRLKPEVKKPERRLSEFSAGGGCAPAPSIEKKPKKPKKGQAKKPNSPKKDKPKKDKSKNKDKSKKKPKGAKKGAGKSEDGKEDASGPPKGKENGDEAKKDTPKRPLDENEPKKKPSDDDEKKTADDGSRTPRPSGDSPQNASREVPAPAPSSGDKANEDLMQLKNDADKRHVGTCTPRRSSSCPNPYCPSNMRKVARPPAQKCTRCGKLKRRPLVPVCNAKIVTVTSTSGRSFAYHEGLLRCTARLSQ